MMWLYSIFPDAMTVWTAVGATATFIAVLVALFGEKIKSKIWGAKIKIYHENKLPFNKLATFDDQKGNKHTGFYIRVKIKNFGRSTVHGVYGKLTKIEYVNKKSVIETYDPSVLRWVGTQKCEPQNLSPKDHDFLDVIFTVENDPNFYVNTEYVHRGSPLIFKKDLNPHLLQIAIYSEDAPTVIKEYQLSFDNNNSFESAKITEV